LYNLGRIQYRNQLHVLVYFSKDGVFFVLIEIVRF